MIKLGNIVTIDDYISIFPSGVRKVLFELRNTIKEAAPDAEEKISYQMPAFFLRGPLVYFAAHKDHIGFYPTPSGIQAFAKELTDYPTSKGVVRFRYEMPLPSELITEIVKFRVTENLEKHVLKNKK
jgi:uncharacterized protein YdhG (YjbR/CyaY superfamily)